MNGDVSDAALDHLLALEVCCLGEIRILASGTETYCLCHRDDFVRDDLVRNDDAESAAEIARYDDAGKYRPLKTAPNLRHGWKLLLKGRSSLATALNLFYPARLSTYAAWKAGSLRTTPLRETLARQSGMYRVAAKITDEEADALIGNFCRSNGRCLRTILWKRNVAGEIPSRHLPAEKYDSSFDQTGRYEPMIPLLCQEACNLLVAEARNVAKATAAA